MTAPAIGTFVRPVGGYGYCLKVVNVIPADRDGDEQWQCRRYGMADDRRTIIEDGHQHMAYINNLREIAPGIWKDEWICDTPRWLCCPLYYRMMDVPGQQMGLF